MLTIRLLAAIAEAYYHGRDRGFGNPGAGAAYPVRSPPHRNRWNGLHLGEQAFSSREAMMITLSPASAARLLESLGQLTLLRPRLWLRSVFWWQVSSTGQSWYRLSGGLLV